MQRHEYAEQPNRLARARAAVLSMAVAIAFAAAFALTLAPAAAQPAWAERLTTQTVSYLPDVTAEMTEGSYWSSKQADPDAVLADRTAIDALNQAGIDADGTMLQPLKEAREYFYDADQQETLKNAAKSELEEMFVGQAEDIDGNILTQADADAILANYPTDGAAPTIASQYAIVTTHTTMRAYPTDRMLGLTPGDADDDNLYLEALRVNEPLIVRTQSADGNYFLCISSCVGASWVPAEDVAICKDKAEWLAAWDIPEGQELVVVGHKVRTEQTRVTPNTANRMLYMGTVLERVDLSGPAEAFQLVGTRSAYYNHVCYLPVRNADGTYSKVLALIAASEQVNEGYLPLTAANIADVALRSLGQMYGWGGMLEANDCSGYVRDVYKCFGLELARNTTWQMNLPVRKFDLTQLDDAHKAAAIAQMPLGTVLFWGGHEMIYLGQEDGKLYVISATGGIANPYEETGAGQVKSVIINTLDLLRPNQNSWLQSLTTANVPYIAASNEGAGLFDLSFYENAVTWPEATYEPTGKAITPSVSIAGLVAGTDYQVTFTNNTKPGMAKAVLSGMGDYSGTLEGEFQILKWAQSIKAKASTSKAFKAQAKTKKLAKTRVVNLKKLAKVSAKTTVKFAKANSAGGKKIAVNAKTGKVTLKKGLKAGTYRVKVKLTAAASKQYEAAKPKTITLKLVVKA